MKVLSRWKIAFLALAALWLLAACGAPASAPVDVPPPPAAAPAVDPGDEGKPAATAGKPQLVEFYADW